MQTPRPYILIDLLEMGLLPGSGLGMSLQQVIGGRLLAGVGGAGINCLVSIIIAGKEYYKPTRSTGTVLTCVLTDMVPIREVASWRSYVNIAATTGRSLGGPIGGFLTDTVGWRWLVFDMVPELSNEMRLIVFLIGLS